MTNQKNSIFSIHSLWLLCLWIGLLGNHTALYARPALSPDPNVHPVPLMRKEYNNIGEINQLILNNSNRIDVFYQPATTKNHIVLSGPEQWVNQVKVSCYKQTLTIDNSSFLRLPKNRFPKNRFPKNRFQIIVYINQLHQLKQLGVGDVYVHHLKNTPFRIIHQAQGNLVIDANQLNLIELTSSGAGNVLITGLMSHYLSVDSSATGNITLSGQIGVAALNTTAQSAGNIIIQGVQITPLTVRADGAANIHLTGHIELVKLIHSGYGNLYFDKVVGHYLSIDEKSYGDATIIGPANVAKLDYAGSGHLYLHGIRAHRLQIHALGSGSLDLDGKINLASIYNTGTNQITIHGIESSNIYVTARYANRIDCRLRGNTRSRGSVSGIHGRKEGGLSNNAADSSFLCKEQCGQMYLSGRAIKLSASLWGYARLNAVHLKVINAFVATYGHALAEVWVNDFLASRAADYSNIYNYNDSYNSQIYTEFRGNVLPMYVVDDRSQHASIDSY